MKPKKHPADSADEEIRANAVKFNVFFQVGPRDRRNVGVQSWVEAKEVAAGMNALHGTFGRRAMIYAIDRIGRTAVCPY